MSYLNLPISDLQSLSARLMSLHNQLGDVDREIIAVTDMLRSGWSQGAPPSLSQMTDAIPPAARSYEHLVRDLSVYLRGLADSIEQANSDAANALGL